ncbi:hypothetical protein DAPPUDRAFT_253454 [Daphnia pulex]|uniref:Uncharacterized protein n=1 Tax=Daphnia pulex TaxID=6669 RepID=E9H4V6_DAPPU|nr:hypothetical protein DAPPUDRAFT_253454 [Daphnia pulex]|eukprot:EFX73211.1 hypothetical protein DAPPUDRAFT_253454 [Daphnia pulex]
MQPHPANQKFDLEMADVLQFESTFHDCCPNMAVVETGCMTSAILLGNHSDITIQNKQYWYET